MAKVALELYGPFGLNGHLRSFSVPRGNRTAKILYRRPKCLLEMSLASPEQPQITAAPIMVNACTGKMGRAVLEAAISAGLHAIPASFAGPEDSGTVLIGGKEIKLYGPSERKSILSSIYDEYPNMVVVDYTVPSTVNDNAELYCEVGVPFVMGTTGGNRERLFKTVSDSNVYAVISPQMGKQVVAFLAILQSMAEQFPGAFAGYNLEVMESHQSSKLDLSGTAKAVISCFEKLGTSFEMDQGRGSFRNFLRHEIHACPNPQGKFKSCFQSHPSLLPEIPVQLEVKFRVIVGETLVQDVKWGQDLIQQIRDPTVQKEMVGVPEEYLSGHAFHMYHLTSPDGTVSFEFQHNVCGRSIYAEGTVDAVLFLAKMVQLKADKRIYDMIDVLREGNMR